MRFARIGLVAALLVAAEAPGRTNVILVSVDTLRSDRLPSYGYRAIRTPQLDRFRADSVLFARAWTHVPLTAPAHASMLTGLLPPAHGIRDNSGDTLDPRVATVPERLATRGYASAAMVSATVMDPKTGLGRGFDPYDAPFDASVKERGGTETVGAALAWIRGHSKRPFFLFVHLYEPHAPYARMDGVADAYDAEIVRVDAIVGQLFEGLRRLRLYDDALILFVSDHGEGLGEHGEKQHGILLHRTTLQVPLIVKFPGARRRGTTVTSDAQLIDLAPTILEAAGDAAGAARLPGMSLAALSGSARRRSIYGETLYPRLQLGWHELHSLLRGDLHLIAGGSIELYDVRLDSREQKNLVNARRRDATSMLGELRDRRVPPRPPTTPLNAEALSALGYLSGGSGAETTFHPDPRDRIVIFDPMLKLMTALRRKEYGTALALAESILAKHPDFSDVWERKAMALLGLGREREADEAIREALRRAPRRSAP